MFSVVFCVKIILFKNERCGYCKKFDPTWKKLKSQKHKGISFQKTVIDDTNQELLNQYNIFSYPTLLLEKKNGKKVVFTRRKHIFFGRGVNIERTIIDYDGNTKVATLDSDPSSGLLRVGDIVNLTAQSADRSQRVSGETLGAGDLRPSNNFAMIDHMSNGRLILGIGPGSLVSDMEMYQSLDKNRLEMFLESIDENKALILLETAFATGSSDNAPCFVSSLSSKSENTVLVAFIVLTKF